MAKYSKRIWELVKEKVIEEIEARVNAAGVNLTALDGDTDDDLPPPDSDGE